MKLIEKLHLEIARYRNKEFVKAAMGACALVAIAAEGVTSGQRQRVDSVVRSLERYPEMDVRKAQAHFLEYATALKRDFAVAAMILERKLERACTTWKRTRTVMRLAWHVQQAPDVLPPAGEKEFLRLCQVFGVPPAVARVPLDSEVSI